MKILVCLFCLFLSHPSLAADPTNSAVKLESEAPKDTTLLDTPDSAACHAEIEKMCKGKEANATAVQKCLSAHQSALSAECKASLDSMKSLVKKSREGSAGSCEANPEKYCASVKESKEKSMCMKAHAVESKAACPPAPTRVKK